MNNLSDEQDASDSRRERLVALLFGELSAEEADALGLEIARDPGLRRDWEEIRVAREALASLPAVEPVPGGAWEPLEAASVRRAAHRREVPGAGGRDSSHPRAADRIRRLLAGPAWGVAAVALLLLALGLARVRVERVDRGIAFTLGPGAAGTGGGSFGSRGAPPPVPAGGNGAFGDIANLAGTTVRQDLAIPPAASYVTRAELRDFGTELSRSLAIFLDQRAGRRDAEMAAWMQVVFEEMSRRQSAGYGDLRGRIEEVGIGLARGQYDANERINLLLREDRGQRIAPAVVPVREEGESPR